MAQTLVEGTEGGGDVDGVIEGAPGNGEEVNMGAVLVVVSGTKFGHLAVQ